MLKGVQVLPVISRVH